MRLPEIIAETDDFVAVNKPAGLLSIPDREGDEVSLKKLLREKYGEIYTVHRIDRNTSGIILFAKNETAHKYFSKAFEERTMEKYYVGIAKGTLSQKTGTIDEPIAQHSLKHTLMIVHKRGKASVTDYKVLEEFGKFSFVEFRIHTGRTHQIRLHMQHIGHPIVCDELYGDSSPVLLSTIKKHYNLSKSELEEKPVLDRLALHAQRLKFMDNHGSAFSLEAEMPKDMRALVEQLRKVSRKGAK
ncbi:MAG: RNA pseudouridine synthase [Chitinophagaceae bacterium]|nr:RNA pseudouridine synthase [Chitinophagaceae bacterium]